MLSLFPKIVIGSSVDVKPGAARNNFVVPCFIAFTFTSETKPESLCLTEITRTIDESKLVTVNPLIFSGMRKVPCLIKT